METQAITGNTYPVKDQIIALGGRWDGNNKACMVPADKADQARALVASAPARAATSKNLSGNRRNCPDVTRPCYKCGTYCYGDCEA